LQGPLAPPRSRRSAARAGALAGEEHKGGNDDCSRLAVEDCLSRFARVGPVAPVEGIGAAPAAEEVVSASSFYVIRAPEAKEQVSSTIAEEGVCAVCPEHDLDRFHEVIAIPARLTGREVNRHRPSKNREENFIPARSSVEDIIAGVVSHEDGISATSPTDDVLAGLVTESVSASATTNHVVSSLSVGEIGAPIAVEEIVAYTGEDRVVAPTTSELVHAALPEEFVPASISTDKIVSAKPVNDVVSALAGDYVTSRRPLEAVGPVRSHNGRLMAEASGRRLRLARDRADGKGAQRNDEKASCRPPENGLAHLPIEPPPWRGVKPSGMAGSLMPRTRLP